MQGLTLPSLRIHQHSTASFPSRQRVVVRWNFAFSLAAAFAFFCALSPWQMPMVVGIADTTSRPMTMMMELFGRWVRCERLVGIAARLQRGRACPRRRQSQKARIFVIYTPILTPVSSWRVSSRGPPWTPVRGLPRPRHPVSLTFDEDHPHNMSPRWPRYDDIIVMRRGLRCISPQSLFSAVFRTPLFFLAHP